jgi:hypothetical protein
MFAGYLVLGGLWLSVVRRRNPQVLLQIAADLAAAPPVPVAGAVLTPAPDEAPTVLKLPDAVSFEGAQLASETA